MTTEYSEYTMYSLVPAPPKQELQEYIQRYIDTGDKKYISHFLHYFEPKMNYAAESLVKKYAIQEHFADVKQAYVTGILNALEHYDISTGVPFAIYLEHYAQNEAMEYIRKSAYGYTTQSAGEFAKMRKIMAIWTEKFQKSVSPETYKQIAEETGEKEEAVKEIILGASQNANFVDFYGENYEDEGIEPLERYIPGKSLSAEDEFFKSELCQELWEAFDNLEYEEKTMLSQYLGICPKCKGLYFADRGDLDEKGQPKLKRIRPMLYTDIATDHGYSTAATVKKKCNKALSKLLDTVKLF